MLCENCLYYIDGFKSEIICKNCLLQNYRPGAVFGGVVQESGDDGVAGTKRENLVD